MGERTKVTFYVGTEDVHEDGHYRGSVWVIYLGTVEVARGKTPSFEQTVYIKSEAFDFLADTMERLFTFAALQAEVQTPSGSNSRT